MNCPRCIGITLVEIDRDGITLDRCDRCRGIWLDRGELEKLIAHGRSQGVDRDRDDSVDRDDRDRDRSRDDDHEEDARGSRGRRRGSWWEIFD